MMTPLALLRLALIEFRAALRLPLFRTLLGLGVIAWVVWSWAILRISQVTGVQGLGLVAAAHYVGVGGLVLGVDLVDRIERRRAGHFAEFSPASGWSIQWTRGVGRALAASLLYLVLPPIHLLLVPLFGMPEWSGPGVLAIGLWIALPLGLFGAFLGLALRTILPSGIASILLGLPVLVLSVGGAMTDGWPRELILPWNATWGLVVPVGLMTREALGWLVAASAWWAVASVLVRPAPAGRVPRVPFGPILAESWRRLRPGLGPGGLLALMLVGFSFSPLSDFRSMGSAVRTLDVVPMPGGAGTRIEPPAILHRFAVLHPSTDPTREHVLLVRLTARGGAEQSLAGLSIGRDWHVVSLDRVVGRVAVVDPGHPVGGPGDMVLLFDPPLRPGEHSDLSLTIRPRSTAWRHLARLSHAHHATFDRLGPWYLDGLSHDMVSRETVRFLLPSTWSVVVVDPMERDWFAAGQRGGRESSWQSSPRLEDGTQARDRVIMESRGSSVPAPLFSANMRRVPPLAPRSWPVDWLVTPRHEDVAIALQRAWEPTLVRLPRLLGEPADRFAFVEIPTPRTGLPMTVASAELSATERRILGEDEDMPVNFASEAELLLAGRLRMLLAFHFDASFERVEEPELLRDAWIEYLHGRALNRGFLSRFQRQRADYVVVPWPWISRQQGAYPFDVTDAALLRYEGPLVGRPAELPAVTLNRREGVHHGLRGILGDEAWVALHRRLFREGGILTLDRWLETASEVGGVDLAEFRRVYIDEGLVPELRLTGIDTARVMDAASGRILYRTRVGLDFRDWNESVPMVVATEGESISLRTPPGATSITVDTVDRPLFAEIDPEGWMIQRSIFNEETQQRVRARLTVRVVRDETTAR